MKALILCAGRGTRLQPLTYTTPKPLIPIANRPVLAYILDDLAQAGISEVGIVVDRFESPIVAYASPKAFPSLDICFLLQSNPQGLAQAVQVGRDFLGDEPFVVCLGDCFAPGAVGELLRLHRAARPVATVGLRAVANPSRFGIAELREGRIERLWEKPAHPRSDLAIVGLYAFEAPVLDAVEHVRPSWRNEYELTDAIQVLIDQGMPAMAFVLSSYWQDVGRPEDVLAANAQWLRQLPVRTDGVLQDCLVEGAVVVGAGSVIEGSVLHGPIAIGRRCRITASHIGPYTSIGDEAEIHRSEITQSILMERCRLEDIRGLEASLIGYGSRLGGGAARPLRLRVVVGDSCTLWVGEREDRRLSGNGLAFHGGEASGDGGGAGLAPW